LLVDDHSRYMWVLVLGSKGEVADAIMRTQAAAEAECGCKLRVLRTDNGGESTTAEFVSYCADQGIQRHYSTPYNPQQNGVVERRNQTVVGMARALLKQRGMPAMFWGEVVVTVVYILNRSPTKALEGRAPYEAWHGRKPAVSHLRVFGCLAFAKELGHVSKLDDTSTPGVFIGYVEGSKAYHILDPRHNVCARRATLCSTKGEDGRGTRRWTTARLRLTTTSLLSTSTSRKLGEWAALLRRACLPQSPSLHRLRRPLRRQHHVLEPRLELRRPLLQRLHAFQPRLQLRRALRRLHHSRRLPVLRHRCHMPRHQQPPPGHVYFSTSSC
jgi:hypothetical protein